MKYEIAEEARADIDGSLLWYQLNLPARRAAFKSAVMATLRRVRQNPEHFPCVYGHAHEAIVSNYKYAVYFIRTGELVRVIAVVHTSRDPEEWQSRVGDG